MIHKYGFWLSLENLHGVLKLTEIPALKTETAEYML